nr:hypothetical protein CFP56_58548 [Quercus suber]
MVMGSWVWLGQVGYGWWWILVGVENEVGGCGWWWILVGVENEVGGCGWWWVLVGVEIKAWVIDLIGVGLISVGTKTKASMATLRSPIVSSHRRRKGHRVPFASIDSFSRPKAWYGLVGKGLGNAEAADSAAS